MDTLLPPSDLPYPHLASIFEDVFEHIGPLTRETSRDHVTRWDSLQHVALVHAIETTFDINLSMDEMMEMRTVGDIEAVLRRHGV